MGRVGEVITAHLADRAQDEGAARRAAGRPRRNDNFRVQALHRQVHDQPGDHARHRARGRLDRGRASWPTWCCGSRPSSASSPSLIIKGGMIAAAPMGDPNASIPTPQPVHYRPMFGAFGGARRAPRSRSSRRRRSRSRLSPALRPASGRSWRCAARVRIGKRDMVHQRLRCPRIEVDPRDLRGARRRRAADLRAGSGAAAWRSATSCSDDRRSDRVRRRSRTPRGKRASRAGSSCRSSAARRAGSARCSIRARRSPSSCRAGRCCAAATASSPRTGA